MFSMKNMKSMMYDVTKKNVQIAMDKIRELIATDNVIDMKDLLGRFTLDTFIEVAFGVEGSINGQLVLSQSEIE